MPTPHQCEVATLRAQLQPWGRNTVAVENGNQPPGADKLLLSRSDHLDPSIPDSRECGQVGGGSRTLPGQIEGFRPLSVVGGWPVYLDKLTTLRKSAQNPLACSRLQSSR